MLNLTTSEGGPTSSGRVIHELFGDNLNSGSHSKGVPGWDIGWDVPGRSDMFQHY